MSFFVQLYQRIYRMTRKDEELWKQYPLEVFTVEMKDEFLQKKADLDELTSPTQFWEETLPPVLVSVPDSDKVKVWVSIYDRQGNRSKPVKLSLYEWGGVIKGVRNQWHCYL